VGCVRTPFQPVCFVASERAKQHTDLFRRDAPAEFPGAVRCAECVCRKRVARQANEPHRISGFVRRSQNSGREGHLIRFSPGLWRRTRKCGACLCPGCQSRRASRQTKNSFRSERGDARVSASQMNEDRHRIRERNPRGATWCLRAQLAGERSCRHQKEQSRIPAARHGARKQVERQRLAQERF